MTDRATALARLLRPRSVAIVGISAEQGSAGDVVLSNLERVGYGGEIHLVSRRLDQIGARRCVRSIDELPFGIDAAALCLPRDAVADAVAACARRGIGSAVIFAAGFAEVDADGRAEQREITQSARAGGVALCGPNCMGFVNFIDRIPLTFDPIPTYTLDPSPAIGVAAQSGAVLTVLRQALLAKSRPVSHLISSGNEADLSIEDFLEFLVNDERTRVIALFVEQIRDPRRFMALAACARSAGKPIVLMHPGRSVRARASALSHTGALAGDHAIMSAFLRHEAVVQVDTLEELLDTAELLASYPVPPVAGTAMVTNSGAFKGYALDLCEAIGLDVPVLSTDTTASLRQVLPPFAPHENPLDLTGQVIKEPAILGRCAGLLLQDPGVGSLIACLVSGGERGAMQKAQSLAPAIAGSHKPVAVTAMCDESLIPKEYVDSFRAIGVPFYRSPDRALRAMAHVTAYGSVLALCKRGAPEIKLSVPELPRKGTVPEYDGKTFLSALGIPVPRGALARGIESARALAARIGYPVVLKAQSAGLAHKSEAGGVIVGIADEQALERAWERLHESVRRAHPDLELDGVLLESMGGAGVEMALGAKRDPEWGPVVMIGLGGVWIEALRDIRLFPPHLGRERVLAEISRLKGAALLRGLRGAPPADIDALADAVLRVSAIMREQPGILELDINPLLVLPRGQGVLALDVLLVVGEGTDKK